MRELFRQATRAASRWSRVRADSFLARIRGNVPYDLKPQTIWDAISLYINVLSIIRLLISFYPESDVVVIPHVLKDVLHVKLNDIVVVSSWILLPILCARALLSQLRAKSKDMEFRTLFSESLFGSRSCIFKSYVPIPTLLLTPLSLWYIWIIVSYIYAHWTVEFVPALQALQLYPAVFMISQSLFQGSYMLWMYALPTFSDIHKKKESFQSDLREYIYLNIVFIVHCVCLTLIAHKDIPGLYHFAVGEIAYRLLAVFAFLSLFHHTTPQNTLPLVSSSNPMMFTPGSTLREIVTEQPDSGPAMLIDSSPPAFSSNHPTQGSLLGHNSPPEPKGVHIVPESATQLQTEGDTAELVTIFQPHVQFSEFSSLDAETMFPLNDTSSTSIPVQCTENNTTLPTPQEVC